MAARKRAAQDSTSAPAPKRRSTRVAAKSVPPVEESPKPKSSTKVKSSASILRRTEPKAPTESSNTSKQVPNPTKGKATSTSAPATAPAQNTSTQRDLSDHVESHVSSDQVSKPILCHTYGGTHDPSKGDLIFTHGAGGTLSAPAVVNFARGYAKSSPVLAFQGSMNLGARVKSFLAIVAENKGQEGNAKSTLRFGGRSMGARAAVMAASQTIAGGFEGSIELVLVSYPLKGPKGDLRDEILLNLSEKVTALLVIGDKDNMCPLEELNVVRRKMKAQTSLLVVKGADHGMHVKPVAAERALGEMTGSSAAKGNGTWTDEQLWWDGDAGEVQKDAFKS